MHSQEINFKDTINDENSVLSQYIPLAEVLGKQYIAALKEQVRRQTGWSMKETENRFKN